MEAISTTQQKQCTQEQNNHIYGRNHSEVNIKTTTLYSFVPKYTEEKRNI